MNDKDKLDMIDMCAEELRNKVALEFLSKDGSRWIASCNDLYEVILNVRQGARYRIIDNKQSPLEETIKLVSENGYEVVKKEPEVKKFVPFPGQVVQTIDRDAYIFQRYEIKEMLYYSNTGIRFSTCEPIPGLVQFRPMSELETGWYKKINLKFEDGEIEYYEWLDYGSPMIIPNLQPCLFGKKVVGFQRLDN